MKINPSGMQAAEGVLAVKYRTFNDLLSRIPRSTWVNQAFQWIQFTCDILGVGLIRDYRNAEFEEWLIREKSLLLSILENNDNMQILKEKAHKTDSLSFLLYLFKEVKS